MGAWPIHKMKAAFVTASAFAVFSISTAELGLQTESTDDVGQATEHVPPGEHRRLTDFAVNCIIRLQTDADADAMNNRIAIAGSQGLEIAINYLIELQPNLKGKFGNISVSDVTVLEDSAVVVDSSHFWEKVQWRIVVLTAAAVVATGIAFYAAMYCVCCRGGCPLREAWKRKRASRKQVTKSHANIMGRTERLRDETDVNMLEMDDERVAPGGESPCAKPATVAGSEETDTCMPVMNNSVNSGELTPDSRHNQDSDNGVDSEDIAHFVESYVESQSRDDAEVAVIWEV